MDDVLNGLYSILENLKKIDDEKMKIENIENEKKDELLNYKSLINDFDNKNKEFYYKSVTPDLPQFPKKGILDKLNKKRYENKVDKFNNELAKRNEIIDNLYNMYEDQYKVERAQLLLRDEENLKLINNMYNTQIDACNIEINNSKNMIYELDLIGENFIEINKVQQLINYFKDRRVNKISEAVNLYYQEQFQNEQLEILNMQNKKFEELKENVDKIKKENGVLKESLDFVLNELDEINNNLYLKS